MELHQIEELRRLCLRWLHERSALAFTARSVQSGISREIRATLPETSEALSFLESSGLIQEAANPLGGSIYYRITAAGTIAQERGI